MDTSTARVYTPVRREIVGNAATRGTGTPHTQEDVKKCVLAQV